MPREEPLGIGAGHRESALTFPENRAKKTCRVFSATLTRFRAFQFHDTSTSSFLRGRCRLTNNRYLQSNGGNLAAILLHLRDHHPHQELLRRVRFLGIVGSSGCGKSSLVKAGLLPALHAGFLLSSDVPWADVERFPNWVASRWFTVDMRPGAHPFRGLARGLLKSGLFQDR